MSQQPTLQVTFLGTGTSSGVPMIGCGCVVCASNDTRDDRLRSSVMVESETTRIVIDTTPDFRTQMLREKVKTLNAVVVTHSHKDHIAGLDDVRAFNFFMNKAMPLFATEATQEVIMREFSYAFANNKYPGVPDITLETIDTDAFSIGDLVLTPIRVWHHRMPVLGFRIGDFTYITDANRIDEEEKEKIKGSKVIVLNALRAEKHISHFTLQEAIDLARELEIPNAYFTHISHQLGLHKVVSETLPSGAQLAYDGLKLSI